jgi:hypothetical protein
VNRLRIPPHWRTIRAVTSFTIAVVCIIGVVEGPALVSRAGADQTSGSWQLQKIDSDVAWEGVSCPSSKMCVETSTTGNVSVYNGETWSTSTPSIFQGRALHSVSCASASFCLAVGDEGGAYLFRQGKWSSAQLLSDDKSLYSVSCPMQGFCAVVGSGGDAYIFSSGGWSSSEPVTSGSTDPLAAVSCTSLKWCMATDLSGQVFAYSGGHWTSGRQVTKGDAPLYSISCPTTLFCSATSEARVGSSYEEVGYTFSKSKWSAHKFQTVGPDDGLVTTCSTSAQCWAMGNADGIDVAYHFSGHSWSQRTKIGDKNLFLYSISCPTTNFCVASGDIGYLYMYKG